MVYTLLLRCVAPLQSWGCGSKFNIRKTEREPTKSGIIGLIAAAMGVARDTDLTEIQEIIDMKFGVRTDREGRLLTDFQTVRAKIKKKDEAYVTNRYYLADAAFVVGLESENKELLEKIVYAIKHPVYSLFFGRRTCVPSQPIVIGIVEEDLITALKNAKSLTSENVDKRITYESYTDGVLIQDVPISFSFKNRQFGYRYKKEIILPAIADDPMSEL